MLKMIRSTILLKKAWHAASLGRWEDVQSLLGEIAIIAGKNIPDEQSPLELNLLYMQSAYFLGQEDWAIFCSKTVFNQLEAVKVLFKRDDFAYLVAYFRRFLLAFSDRFPDSESEFQSIRSRVVSLEIEDARVSRLLRSHFPIPK